MENNQTNKKTEQRVVLNLSLSQAKQLNAIISNRGQSTQDDRSFMEKIANRMQKTITKHENSNSFETARILIHGEAQDGDL